MGFLNYLLIFLYISLIFANYHSFQVGRKYGPLLLFTVCLATMLLFSSNVARFDWEDVGLDMSGYRTIYEQYDVLEHPDFKMYYIFYSLMYIGQLFGLSYYSWWMVMSIMAMIVLVIACKVHRFNFQLFLVSFMIYHEFVFYSGFKFFYGFCFFLLAFGYLMQDSQHGRLKYILCLCLAGGFHTMYYFYLLFLIKPKKNPEQFVKTIAVFSIVFTILMRISGSAITFLAPFFDMLDNEHINKYTELNVNMGFYLPIALQAVIIYIASKMRKYRIQKGINDNAADTIYYSAILSLVFCPFFALALTFMRLQTAFSLLLITANTYNIKEISGRLLCGKMALLMVFSFWLILIVDGLEGFINNSVLPIFDVF